MPLTRVRYSEWFVDFSLEIKYYIYFHPEYSWLIIIPYIIIALPG